MCVGHRVMIPHLYISVLLRQSAQKEKVAPRQLYLTQLIYTEFAEFLRSLPPPIWFHDPSRSAALKFIKICGKEISLQLCLGRTSSEPLWDNWKHRVGEQFFGDTRKRTELPVEIFMKEKQVSAFLTCRLKRISVWHIWCVQTLTPWNNTSSDTELEPTLSRTR